MEKQSLKKFYIKKQESKSGNTREILGKKQQSPKIYRIITEKAFLVSLILTIILVAVIITSFNFYQNLEKKREIEKKREKIVLEIKYWQGIANNYQGYRDAYFKLAILEYQLNNKAKTNEYLQKVFELDPNFEAGREFKKLLKK